MVRYLYGDDFSVKSWTPQWHIDQLRFDEEVICRMVQLDIYSWHGDKFNALKNNICSNDMNAVEEASRTYDREQVALRHTS